jgi:hypothetical protein
VQLDAARLSNWKENASAPRIFYKKQPLPNQDLTGIYPIEEGKETSHSSSNPSENRYFLKTVK